MKDTPPKLEGKPPECKIPIHLPDPVKCSLRIIALLLLILQKCWMSLTATALVFTVVHVVFGGWISTFFLCICIACEYEMLKFGLQLSDCHYNASTLILFLVCAVILYYAEDCLLYYPNVPKNSRVVVLEPTLLGMPHETVYIRSADGTLLHCFLIRQPEPICNQASTILFLHGNAGNIGNR